MFTSLDLLVIVGAVLAAVSLFSLCMMFFIRNKSVARVFFYIASAMGCYISWVGFRIGFGGGFTLQMIFGVLTALLIIGAIVIERVFKDNKRLNRCSHIISALSLAVAACNAFVF